MSDFDDLPTLDQAARTKRRNGKGTTRLEQRTATDADDRRREVACTTKVWRRDEGKCRVCGTTVTRTLALDPKRGETHHLAPRADRRVRFDPRNRILVHLRCHARFKAGTIRVVRDTAQTFAIDGRIYLDADHPLTFTDPPEI